MVGWWVLPTVSVICIPLTDPCDFFFAKLIFLACSFPFGLRFAIRTTVFGESMNPRLHRSVIRRVAICLVALIAPAVSISLDAASPTSTNAREYRRPIDELNAIRDYLLLADPIDRGHLRFLTFSHLVNNPRISDQDLCILRAAVSKLLNSLSWHSQIYVPQIVESTQGSVLAIDLRHWKWSDGKQWLQIVQHYPYGLKRNFVRDAELKEVAADIEQLAGTELPYIRADWFVFAASRPPLYSQLLQLPTHLTELASQLNVPLDIAISDSTAARAGFSQSRVALQNRLVERHESRFGALWLSYDFAPRRGRADLIRYPLGPKSFEKSMAPFAFEHDVSQALFHLPNGLLAYFSADAQGARSDNSLSVDIAYDSMAAAGTPATVTGVSCMRCHRDGIVPDFRDEVRAASALSGNAKELLDRLYIPHEQMNRLIERDNRQYRTAIQAATKPFLLHTAESMAELGDGLVEPVSYVTKEYLRDLGPQEIALEIGIPNLSAIEFQIANDRELKRLGLGILLQQTPGVIKRVRWEAIDGTSFFQDVVVELGLGTPLVPGTVTEHSHPVSYSTP